MVQWQNETFPRFRHEFDSRYPLKNMEKHLTGIGSYIKDIVYGANDGIITTFAIVAGSYGADFSPKVILILGSANLLADGFSMAASNFLGSRSENDWYKEEEKREYDEVKNLPDKEKEEVREVFIKFGYNNQQARELSNLISANENFWVDFMMKYELKMNPLSAGSEWKSALATFISFVLAGSLPILPFVFLPASDANRLLYSVIATGVALFTVGASRYFVTGVNWLISGLEMLLVGGIAAGVSYFVGYLISAII